MNFECYKNTHKKTWIDFLKHISEVGASIKLQQIYKKKNKNKTKHQINTIVYFGNTKAVLPLYSSDFIPTNLLYADFSTEHYYKKIYVILSPVLFFVVLIYKYKNANCSVPSLNHQYHHTPMNFRCEIWNSKPINDIENTEKPNLCQKITIVRQPINPPPPTKTIGWFLLHNTLWWHGTYPINRCARSYSRKRPRRHTTHLSLGHLWWPL